MLTHSLRVTTLGTENLQTKQLTPSPPPLPSPLTRFPFVALPFLAEPPGPQVAPLLSSCGPSDW